MRTQVPEISKRIDGLIRLLALAMVALFSFAATCNGQSPIPSITARTAPNQFGGSVTIQGSGFPPGNTIRFEYRQVPQFDGAFSAPLRATVDSQGKFEVVDGDIRCTTHDRDANWNNVLISAIDTLAAPSENPATTVSPSVWVCR